MLVAVGVSNPLAYTTIWIPSTACDDFSTDIK